MKFASDYDPTSATAAAIAGSIEGSLGLILNTLNIFAILKSKKLRNNAIAPLLCALAFSDIAFCLMLIPVVHQFYKNEPYQEESFLCYFTPIGYRCAILSSVLCMSMISLQRVLSMRSLLRNYSFFTPKKTLACMTILWSILVSFHFLPAFNIWGKIGHRSGYPFCTIWKNNEDVFFYPDTLVYLFGYFFPLTVLTVSYALMYKQLKDSTFRSGNEGQVSKSALIMVGGFIFIYTPGLLNSMFNDLSSNRGSPQLASSAWICAWSHAFINPICYIFFNSYYRTEYLITLKIKKGDIKETDRLSRASSTKIRGRLSRSPSQSPRLSTQVSIDPAPLFYKRQSSEV